MEIPRFSGLKLELKLEKTGVYPEMVAQYAVSQTGDPDVAADEVLFNGKTLGHSSRVALLSHLLARQDNPKAIRLFPYIFKEIVEEERIDRSKADPNVYEFNGVRGTAWDIFKSFRNNFLTLVRKAQEKLEN